MSQRKTHRREPRYVAHVAVLISDIIGLVEGCRYDACYPASEAESFKIERLLHDPHPEDVMNRVIRLVQVDRSGHGPDVGRWRSFNCRVLDVRHPDESPPSDEELRNRINVKAWWGE